MRLILTLLAAIMLVACPAGALATDDTRTQIFDPTFRSLQIMVDGNDMCAPVVVLGSNKRLTISFDRIADDRDWLRYELIHCNSDWRPSGLVSSEFLTGFNEGTVDDYAFSRATTTHYVHYDITLPNEQVNFTASGNYLLRVYDESDPDLTLLQARFYVSEATMTLDASVSPLTMVDYNVSHQEVSAVADIKRVGVRDIWSDLRLVVEQNGRPDTQRSPRSPLKVAGTKAFFEHNRDLVFDAGNEYRRMEVISTDFNPPGVESIGRVGDRYAFYLYPDYPRAGSGYLYDRTQHGRFRIREYNTDLPSTEADYVEVCFRLEMPEVSGGDIFLDGDFTNRLFDPGSLMVYNRAEGAYETVLTLKQGAYNYQYLFVPYGSMAGTTSVVEGDFAPTDNEYFLRLYWRAPGERYDRLTATQTVTY